MSRFKLVRKSYALVTIGALEIGTPFVRMIVLSRMLDLRELGFAAALASAYGLFEQVTDIAIYRFIYSMPREDYVEAMGAAHALSALRGIIVALLAVAVAPLIATAFSLRADWTDFALIGGVVLIRSFEHLEPKVAERDYRFGPQLTASIVSNGMCFIAMIGALALWRNHQALTASLYGLVIGLVVASHLVSKTSYQLKFRSPLFVKAFYFGYPLMLNGLGLALSAQGDRFLVGAMLGLPALGVYSVVMLAVIVPISMVYRIMGSMTAAALYNAQEAADSLRKRVRLISRLSPMVAAIYAIGVLFLGNIVVPLAFGPHFYLSQLGLSLLAFAAFLRIARGEPFGSLLLLAQRTKRLALGNLSVVVGLLFAFAIMNYQRSVEGALSGRALGELLSLGVTILLTRNLMHGAGVDYLVSLLVGGLFVATATATIFLTPVGTQLQPSLLALLLCAILFSIWGTSAAQPLFASMKPPVIGDRPAREGL